MCVVLFNFFLESRVYVLHRFIVFNARVALQIYITTLKLYLNKFKYLLVSIASNIAAEYEICIHICMYI